MNAPFSAGPAAMRIALASLAHLRAISVLSSGGYFVSLNSSRPISIRLISDVPAPISYNGISPERRSRTR
jgi:hypothetical protein